jgi:hypothetical protein
MQSRSDARFDGVHSQNETVQSRTGTRFDTLQAHADSRFDAVQRSAKALDDKIDAVDRGLRVIIDSDVNKRINAVYETCKNLTDEIARVADLSDKVDNIQATVDVLKHVFKSPRQE